MEVQARLLGLEALLLQELEALLLGQAVQRQGLAALLLEQETLAVRRKVLLRRQVLAERLQAVLVAARRLKAPQGVLQGVLQEVRQAAPLVVLLEAPPEVRQVELQEALLEERLEALRVEPLAAPQLGVLLLDLVLKALQHPLHLIHPSCLLDTPGTLTSGSLPLISQTLNC